MSDPAPHHRASDAILALRHDFASATLAEGDVHPDPAHQLDAWLADALAAQVNEPNAMTLATATADGRPSARVMLVRGIDHDAAVRFFTNYESRKGRELEANPFAAGLFFWSELERQVRIEGSIERLPDADNDAYFATRPLASRLGAWASPQSQPIASRAVLDAREADAQARFGSDPPRPPHWGGFRLVPTRVELWQGRPSRLHDRLVYTRGPSGWTIGRLAP